MDVSNDNNHRKSVLIDSSSAIILFKAGLLDHIVNYFSPVISESVFLELTRGGHAGSDEFIQYGEQKKIRMVSEDGGDQMVLTEKPGLAALGKGERDTILLYYRKAGDMIILDDRKGARFCRNNRIPYINALLVPRLLTIAGCIREIEKERYMEKIIEYARYSPGIIEYARSCKESELTRFL